MRRTLRELFVDRSRQIEAFSRMLEGQIQRRIMVLSAGPGMGKSWVIQMFAYEAHRRQIPLVQIDFSDSQAYDTLMLVRRCRDAFGPDQFNTLTQAINDATVARVALTTDVSAAVPAVEIGFGEH